MALRLLHRLRIFAAVFALPPAVAGGLSDSAFGAAATRLAAGAYDEMQAWVRWGPAGPAAAVLPRRGKAVARRGARGALGAARHSAVHASLDCCPRRRCPPPTGAP